jgi:ATP-dependent DNA helicase RecG
MSFNAKVLMSLNRVERLLLQKENIRLEFKESRIDLPGNLFETICAMLNREGGDILLGVMDDGSVQGIDDSRIEIIKSNLVNLSNNPQKLDPPFILFPQVYTIRGNSIIHIQVPASSQVHRSAGVVYDRSNDGDFRVTQPQQIAEIYNRKRAHYTEGIIYTAIRFEDFKAELFPKIRNLISSNNSNHPWLALNDVSMLQMAGLWKRDPQSGQEGYTLGAVLLLGKDEVIQSVLPHYKIDALVRKVNLVRYDDREYIQTNLIEAYDQLMAFAAKHLADKFYMEGDQRVSLRTKIFREVVANLIVHREYTNAHPATFIIYKDRVETENANNPHGEGPIDPNNFAPFPKNPSIAKFFIQLGRVDELGSGVLNVNRFAKDYAGSRNPQFIEGSTFKMIVPVSEGLNRESEGINGVTEGINLTTEGIKAVIEGLFTELRGDAVNSLTAILFHIYNHQGSNTAHMSDATGIPVKSVQRYIKQLKEVDLVKFTGARKTGGYFVTDNFIRIIKNKPNQ